MQQRLVRDFQGWGIGGRIVEGVMLFPDRTEATEGPSISTPRIPMQCWNENHDWERYILDSLRVPVILDPALLDSPSTSGFTLQSKIDILLLSAIWFTTHTDATLHLDPSWPCLRAYCRLDGCLLPGAPPSGSHSLRRAPLARLQWPLFLP